MTYLLDGIDITDYINHEFEFREEKNLVGEDLINVYEFDLLLNSDKSINYAFDPEKETSIWYGRKPTESVIYIYDSDNILIYTGYVKNYNYDYMNQTMNLKISSYLGKLLNRSILFYEDEITPAEAFKTLLYSNFLENYFSTDNYYESLILQEDNSLYCSFQNDLDSSSNVLSILQGLAFAGADIYTKDNKIVYEQYNPNRVIQAGVVVKDFFLSEEITLYSDTDNVQNDFNISTNLFSYSGNDTEIGQESRLLEGSKPALDIDLSNTNNISCEVGSALLWVGEIVIQRNLEPKTYAEFSVNANLVDCYLCLNQIFTFENDITGNWEIISFSKIEDIINIKAVRV